MPNPRPLLSLLLSVLGLCTLSVEAPAQNEKVHFSYLWHMEQPIYWPDQQVFGDDRYERAWESIQQTDGGAAHPENDLRAIFSVPDRVAAYQWRVRDSINAIRGYPEAGAQVSYSGGLIENLQSLGGAWQLGYSPTWYSSYREARGWTTSGQSVPRCDLVVFPFHHPLLPLLDDSTIRKEIQLYKAVYDDAWGSHPGQSKGFFPPEMAFSTRLIPILEQEGIEWCFVSGEKISRACTDFPVVFGSGGINCDPPNQADQLNPAQGDYYRESISRGCGPAEAFPFAFTPHRAGYVDPNTGQLHSIVVVPCSQSLGWRDGYSPLGLGAFDTLQTKNDPSRPMLVVLAHDGDNNWGGGYSYYMDAVPNFVQSAQSSGYHATMVEEYLRDHPVPANDYVHVEDGAWVNADGDFGSPQFLNWNWPPVNGAGEIDIANGWAEDIRNWAVITACQNHVDTAEQVWLDAGGSVNIDRILYPWSASNDAERAWHYFLGALNSGFMYYGTSLDMEVKPTIACNEAWQHTNSILSGGGTDRTPPTIWTPQRHPWNPGSVNFGPQWGYQEYQDDGDFWVWTFIHDVSGLQSVTLKYRIDQDGTNPLSSFQNETYAGGAEVGAWQNLTMSARPFPDWNFFNDGSINFFEMPQRIADQYYVEVTGIREKLVDYYIEAVDNQGNVRRGPIQHVWAGDGQGGGNGNDAVEISPDPARTGQPVAIRYDASGGPLATASQVFLHIGINNWAWVEPNDPQMSFNTGSGRWEVVVPVPDNADQLDMVFHDGAGNWDNNGGQDWHFDVVPGSDDPRWQIDGHLDPDATLLASNNGVNLWAGLKGDILYLATEPAAGKDRFVFVAENPGNLRLSPWAKGGQVAQWDAYLANEESNGYVTWTDATGYTEIMADSILEGSLNLKQELGSIPNVLYLAVGLYDTQDNGVLDPNRQIDQTVNGDGNLDGIEFLSVDLTTLRKNKWVFFPAQ